MAPHSPWFARRHGRKLLLLGHDIAMFPMEMDFPMLIFVLYMRGFRGACPTMKYHWRLRRRPEICVR